MRNPHRNISEFGHCQSSSQPVPRRWFY